MKNSGDAWSLNWRRDITDALDMLIGALAFVVAYATIDGAADSLDLLIAGVLALVVIGLMLEPIAVAQSTPGIGPQRLRPLTGSNAGSRQWLRRHDRRSDEPVMAVMAQELPQIVTKTRGSARIAPPRQAKMSL